MNDPKSEYSRTQAEAASTHEEQTAAQPDPFKVLEALQAENTELKDKVLRTLADMENLRRRTEREVSDAKIYGVASFARDMLTFADNLRRAVEAVPASLREEADPALKTFVEGIELTERDFISRLTRFGVKKIDPLGKKFDPNFQEALFEIPDRIRATRHCVASRGIRFFDRRPRSAPRQGRRVPWRAEDGELIQGTG